MNTDREDPLTYALIGAAMAVHGALGPGFLEAVYHEARTIELSKRSIPFCSETELPIFYAGQKLKTYYRTDLICYESVIVELKAISGMTGVEKAQVLNYLKQQI